MVFQEFSCKGKFHRFVKSIRETTEFVELFLRNLLLGETNELKNRYLHIRWKEQKQDIEDTKQDIDRSNRLIGVERIF